jgi:hypothetical protein
LLPDDYVVSAAAGGLKFFGMFGPLAISHLGRLDAEDRLLCSELCAIFVLPRLCSSKQPYEQFAVVKQNFAFVSRYDLSGPVLARYHC